ncbi:MAG: hypothetical protein JNJ47_07440 [Alphaproteobacteria bacterium]|nr:hypothetical protein [Alphaproteobacteria bacterium]
MLNPELKISPLPTNQNFSDFEKEALGEMILKAVQSDLQRYLDRFHLHQIKDFEAKMAGLEQKCVRQIQASIEENVKLQLDGHFQKVVESCQKDISQMSYPLFKRAEKDVQSLTDTVTKAHAFCENIQTQYALRWSPPFFALVGTAGLTGALIGLFLLFSQVPFISVFFMNAHMREAYVTGLRVIEMRKELETQTTQISASQAISQEQAVQKAPEAPKPNASQKQKKKKKSK